MTTGQGSPGARAGHVRAGPMRPIGVLLREHGVDPAAVLRECGLPATALDDADAQLSYRDGGCLFQRAAWALQRPDFGLLVGERFELASLGLLGDLMRQAPTVGGALDSLVRFFHLQDRGSALYLRQPEAGLVAVGYSIHDVDVPGSGLAYDAVMAMLMRALRALCGPRFRVVELHLAHAAPADTAPYRRLFGVPAVFDAPHSELRFDRRWLDARVAGGRDNAMGVVRRAAQAVEAADPPHLDERVRVAVRVLLAAGDVSAPRLAHLRAGLAQLPGAEQPPGDRPDGEHDAHRSDEGRDVGRHADRERGQVERVVARDEHRVDGREAEHRDLADEHRPGERHEAAHVGAERLARQALVERVGAAARHAGARISARSCAAAATARGRRRSPRARARRSG